MWSCPLSGVDKRWPCSLCFCSHCPSLQEQNHCKEQLVFPASFPPTAVAQSSQQATLYFLVKGVRVCRSRGRKTARKQRAACWATLCSCSMRAVAAGMELVLPPSPHLPTYGQFCASIFPPACLTIFPPACLFSCSSEWWWPSILNGQFNLPLSFQLAFWDLSMLRISHLQGVL